MSLDGYMYLVNPGTYKIGQKKEDVNIKGETSDARFQEKGAFQIRNFNWECERMRKTLGTEDGAEGGTDRLDTAAVVKAFTVKKDIDIATPTLFFANVTGSVFKGAHVYFRKTTGAKLETFFHVIFSEVILEKWVINLEGEDASEQLTWAFNWVQVNYYPQTRDGTRRKDSPANMKQYCTSNPENTNAPDVFKRDSQGGS